MRVIGFSDEIIYKVMMTLLTSAKRAYFTQKHKHEGNKRVCDHIKAI